ncbi:MAG TPA: cytochrome c family protein, partial [Caulobacteraceae bacterium]
PDLYAVFGRKAGTSPGFAYSDGLKALGITWDAASLDKWIANPRAMVPGTKMTYIGLSDPKDRTDLIAYLKTVTSPPPPG